jgi:hypothetical protein
MRFSAKSHPGCHYCHSAVIGSFQNTFALSLCYRSQDLNNHLPHRTFGAEAIFQEYGRYAAEPNEVQLSRYFHLDERDLDFINQCRGRHNRLGIALQLTTARFLGTFLNDLMQTPAGVRIYVAAQLGIPRPEVLSRYALRENTRWEHHALIRQHYGYHDLCDFPWAFRLKRLLYTRAWLSNERPGLMFDFATVWLLQHKVLLPAASTLTRILVK